MSYFDCIKIGSYYVMIRSLIHEILFAQMLIKIYVFLKIVQLRDILSIKQSVNCTIIRNISKIVAQLIF